MDLNDSGVSGVCRGHLLALEEFLKSLVPIKSVFWVLWGFFQVH